MNQDDLRFDPEPDPRLRAALRDLEGEPPLEQVDFEALRRSIAARAELPLARRRRVERTVPRTAPLRWLQPLIPAAAAAGLAALAFFGMRGPAGEPQPMVSQAEVRQADFVTAEEALRADLSDDEFVLLVSGMADSDALLRVAAEGP